MMSIEDTKQTLSQLAEIASNEIYINKTLHNAIAQKKNLIKQNKKLFTNISSITNKSSILSQIQTELINYNKNIQKLNDNIRKQNEQLKTKIKKLKADYFTINSSIIEELEKTKEDNFILSNTIMTKENCITRLNDAYESITQFAVFQEPKRDLFIKYTRQGDVYFGERLTGMQNCLYLHLKKYNKWSNRRIEKKKLYKELVKEIRLLKEENKDKQSKKKRNEILTQKTQKISYHKKVIPTFTKKEEILNPYSSSDSEHDAIIDEELHSDEELNFEPKIKPINSISVTYNNILREKVPVINLKQIEYNKAKYKEIDLYSLERRVNKESLRGQINEVTSKIKDIKKKLKKNKIKFEKFEDFINKYKRNLSMLRHLSTKSSFYTPTYTFEENEKFEQDYADAIVNTVTVSNKNKLHYIDDVTDLKSI